MTELVKENRGDSRIIVQHALLLSRELGLHDRAERLLQHAVDLCAPRAAANASSTASASAQSLAGVPGIEGLTPAAAAEYAWVLRRYFDFLLGVRGDLRQCAHILVLLSSLDRALGVEPRAGKHGRRDHAASAAASKTRPEIDAGDRPQHELTHACQRRISASYLVCSARFHWLLALQREPLPQAGSPQGPPARAESHAAQSGAWTRKALLHETERLLVSAYSVLMGEGPQDGPDGAAVGAGGGDGRKADSGEADLADLDILAGEVMTCMGWVALEKGQYREVEKCVVAAVRRRGLLSCLRPVAVDTADMRRGNA
jgi:hypothetical protein